MVLLSTLEEWQKQSTLLLQARPTTARVTTKYNIPNLSSPRYEKKLTRVRRKGDGTEKEDSTSQEPVPRAILTLKTYDPVSGVTLKFETDRAADVGRLFAGLGGLGRYMAALPLKTEVKSEDVPMPDASNAVEDPAAPAETKATPQSTTTGGGKKKKKGKK